MTVALVRSRLAGPHENRVLMTAWARGAVMRAEFSGTNGLSGRPSDVVDEHLRADADEADARWLSIADVIVRAGSLPLSAVFASHPGCLIAAVAGPGDHCVVGGRDGWSVNVAGRSVVDPRMYGWYASFAHFWNVSGRSPLALADACVTIAGSGRRTVTFIGPKS